MRLTTFYQTVANDNLQVPTIATKKAWGAGYVRMGDYLVCNAFDAASEEPFVGTSQKGKEFFERRCMSSTTSFFCSRFVWTS
jgi:hypothetical protein